MPHSRSSQQTAPLSAITGGPTEWRTLSPTGGWRICALDQRTATRQPTTTQWQQRSCTTDSAAQWPPKSCTTGSAPGQHDKALQLARQEAFREQSSRFRSADLIRADIETGLEYRRGVG